MTTEQKIVATIRAGHKINTAGQVFEVLGSMKARSGYKYICRTATGAKVTLDRADVLQAQRDGDATVTA